MGGGAAARLGTVLVFVVLSVPFGGAQDATNTNANGDQRAACTQTQKDHVNFCYSHSTEDKCVNSATNDPQSDGSVGRSCVWCPGFMTRVGRRDLCRALLNCGIWVEWDMAPDYMQFQNGCLDLYSDDAVPWPSPRSVTVLGCALIASVVVLWR